MGVRTRIQRTRRSMTKSDGFALFTSHHYLIAAYIVSKEAKHTSSSTSVHNRTQFMIDDVLCRSHAMYLQVHKRQIHVRLKATVVSKSRRR
jgi:hypothetical protein